MGVSGLPSDPAFVEAIVRHDGGDPSRIRLVTIGFAAVSALLSGKVAVVPAFWNAEGVVLRRKGRDVREFRVEDYGAPRIADPSLRLDPDRLRAWADFATDIGILRERPDVARAFDVTLTSAPADR